MIRLQKILSTAGIASRRASEQMILDGRVMVNGKTILELGAKADPEKDAIKVDGRRIKTEVTHRYIVLYKPKGYVTTRKDPEGRRTVMDLIGDGAYIYPVGRLDYDSEGLLVLTSDGELAALLTHPRHGIEREYEVRVRGVPDQHDLDRLSRGISLEGRRTAPAVVELTKVIDAEKGQQALLSFVIREGRNRQVRNMCDAIGHPVVRLRRKRIGPITDEHIRPGEFRDLTPREVAMLRKPGASGSHSLPPKGGSHADSSGAPSGYRTSPAASGRSTSPVASGFSRKAAAGGESPARATTARPRTGSGATSRRPPAGGRPRRG